MNDRRRYTLIWPAAALLVMLASSLAAGGPSPAADPALTVAISPDIPPYVMEKATTGIEVDIVRQALPGYSIRFIQMPYEDLQTAVPMKRADISLGVQRFTDDGVFYSDDFVAFQNVAITKKSSGLRVGTIGDLADHKVLAWEDAWRELGPEFEHLFSPDSPQRRNYVEIGDQREQVRMFWKAPGAVLVIDQSIYSYFSAETGHTPGEAVVHPLFPDVTEFRAGFENATVRDAFDRGLAGLCQTGSYAKILARYHVVQPRTVCDDQR